MNSLDETEKQIADARRLMARLREARESLDPARWTVAERFINSLLMLVALLVVVLQAIVLAQFERFSALFR